MNKPKRNQSIEISCTEDEKTLLKHKAEQAGMNLTRYLVDCGLNHNQPHSISQAQLYWSLELLRQTIELHGSTDRALLRQAIELTQEAKRSIALNRLEVEVGVFTRENTVQ